MEHNTKSYMDLALQQAQIAFNNNEVPIGAIIVNDKGEVIAYGHNLVKSACNPIYHAEIVAIGEACKYMNNYRLENCSIYVTAEPCVMCAGAIMHSRIKRIYYGCKEHKYGAVESNAKVFNHKYPHKVETYGGIQEKQCADILQKFFANKRG